MKTLVVVVALAVLGFVGSCPAAELEGRQMTAREMRAGAAWLEDVSCYEFEMVSDVTTSGFNATCLIEHQMLGDRYSRSEMGVLGFEIETLCDGDSLWTVNHFAKTYTVEPWLGMNVPREGPYGAAGSMTPPFAFDFIVDMLSPWYMPGQEDEFYTFVGNDSLVTDERSTPCEMWVFAPDSTMATRIWLEPSQHIVLKSESAVRAPSGEAMTAEMTVMRVKVDHGLQPQDFVFVPLEGYTRVGSTKKLQVHDSLEGQLPADFALTDLAGAAVDTRDWRGKVVLLDYFGTRCPPCVKEFGHLQDLRSEYGDDVVMVGITSDEARKVERFVQQHEVTLPIWLDARGEVRDAYRVQSIPALYILDGSGTVREHFVGLQTPETLREALRNLGILARNQ